MKENVSTIEENKIYSSPKLYKIFVEVLNHICKTPRHYFNAEDMSTAFNDIDVLSELALASKDKELIDLVDNFREYLILMDNCEFKEDEFLYHHLFDIYGQEVIDYCSWGMLIETTEESLNNGKDIPDKWVKINGKLAPVEIKFGQFNKAAIKQLKRYMTVYNTDYGIAIGDWSDDLYDVNDNILFIEKDLFRKKYINNGYKC